MKADVIVIGGGPAGMFAAVTAAKNGAGVLLLQGPLQCNQRLHRRGGSAEYPPERPLFVQRYDGLSAGKNQGLF